MQIELEGLVFVPAYIENKRCGVKTVKTNERNSGLYFIKENGTLVYIGMSAFNIKKVLYRHFQKWGPDKSRHSHYRVNYDKTSANYEVAIVVVPDSVHEVEKANIIKYKPRDNRKLYEEYPDDMIKEMADNGVIINNDDLNF